MDRHTQQNETTPALNMIKKLQIACCTNTLLQQVPLLLLSKQRPRTSLRIEHVRRIIEGEGVSGGVRGEGERTLTGVMSWETACGEALLQKMMRPSRS